MTENMDKLPLTSLRMQIKITIYKMKEQNILINLLPLQITPDIFTPRFHNPRGQVYLVMFLESSGDVTNIIPIQGFNKRNL